MATKKTSKKKMEEMKTTADKMREKYAELAKLNDVAKESMQAAYRFARDNSLLYTVPKVEFDKDDFDKDEDYDESWESSMDC